MTRRRAANVLVALIAAASGYLVFAYLQRPQPSFKEAVAFLRSVYPFVEPHRQRVLISLRLRDGRETVMSIDGSIFMPGDSRVTNHTSDPFSGTRRQ